MRGDARYFGKIANSPEALTRLAAKLSRRQRALVSVTRPVRVATVWVPGAAHEAMRGVALITAVTLLAEIGDLTRFDSPRQLMSQLGLVPPGG